MIFGKRCDKILEDVIFLLSIREKKSVMIFISQKFKFSAALINENAIKIVRGVSFLVILEGGVRKKPKNMALLGAFQQNLGASQF